MRVLMRVLTSAIVNEGGKPNGWSEQCIRDGIAAVFF